MKTDGLSRKLLMRILIFLAIWTIAVIGYFIFNSIYRFDRNISKFVLLEYEILFTMIILLLFNSGVIWIWKKIRSWSDHKLVERIDEIFETLKPEGPDYYLSSMTFILLIPGIICLNTIRNNFEYHTSLSAILANYFSGFFLFFIYYIIFILFFFSIFYLTKLSYRRLNRKLELSLLKEDFKKAKSLAQKKTTASYVPREYRHLLSSLVRKERPGILSFLIQHGFDVNKTYHRGKTPLHILLEQPEVNESYLHILLRNGADIHKKDRNNRSPLDVAKENARLELVEKYTDPWHTVKDFRTQEGKRF